MDILSIDAMSDAEIAEILDRAAQFFTGNRGRRSAERLHGKIVFNLFYENSTRTAMSFATAAHRLGASAISLSVERSSVQKGETLEDTARTLNAMRPDALVMRHRENGAPAAVALLMDAPVLNAGDGTNEHPTQALLDLFTMKEARANLSGAKVAIIGDIMHSRVARSNIWLLKRVGAEAARFSRACRARVDRSAAVITKHDIRLGRWMNWDDSYYTYTDNNISHIWHVLKLCHEKGWLYKGHRAMPWCARCGTALSEHEMTGSYKEMTHTSLYVRFSLTGARPWPAIEK